uniref:Uncharacterized protein n=1 Tax=viral metagenome TaxID=1070528 RepID=A0A6H2A485_9ZZZZ
MEAKEPRTVLFTGGRQMGRTQLAIEKAYQLGLQDGRKEVVEWGLETCPHDLFGEGTHYFKRACDQCWLEKGMDWGIK